MRNKEKDTINIVIGKHMAELRAKFNLSQKEICQVIGVNRNTYKDYEIGNRTIPLQILRDLSKFYKVSSDYFFENMPELSEKKQRQLFRYSTAVANDKEKYIALDLTNQNAMKEYFDKEEKKIQSKVRLIVKQLRLDNNKTQDEIAKYLNVDKSTYNKYENGKRKFNNDVVKKLAEYYNIKVSDIVD